MKRYLIGITGGTASGKSFFAKILKENIESILNLDTTIFIQDNYFFEEKKQPKDENGQPNFDTPKSLDLDKFKQDFLDIISGKDIHQQRYNYNKPIVNGENMLTFKSNPVIIFEGIFTFYFKELFEKYDLRIFVDSDFETKIKRRIHRDSIERGYDEDDVRYKFDYHVKPSYKKYIEPFKIKSDLLIENRSDFTNLDSSIEIILRKIKKFFNQ